MNVHDNIYEIIQELNIENGSNYKISVLKKYQENKLLEKVLAMTLDRVAFTYGATLKQIDKFPPIESNDFKQDLDLALDLLNDQICSRELTGHAGYQFISNLIAAQTEQNQLILRCIINRDLRINIGKTQINKVWKNLITKPAYMRCGVFGPKTQKHVQFPAPIQLKADGTYREFSVLNENVECRSRSGEEYNYPLFNEDLSQAKNGVYNGELTVVLTVQLLALITPKIQKLDKKNGTDLLGEITQAYQEHKDQNREYILPRSLGNGLINSDEIPHENIKLELWDFITHDEYDSARLKLKNTTKYSERFENLQSVLSQINNQMIRLIPYKIVNNVAEALKQCSEWMNDGYEGGVLKDWNMVFKDGTSNQQLKMKLIVEAEVRCIGYREGRVGTKREGKIGSLQFATDDGNVKGYCSGFSDEELDEFSENFDTMCKDRIMSVQFNDLTKGRSNDYYALSHPRFDEWRNDKDETDTLERIFELRDMAMCLS